MSFVMGQIPSCCLTRTGASVKRQGTLKTERGSKPRAIAIHHQVIHMYAQASCDHLPSISLYICIHIYITAYTCIYIYIHIEI